MFIEKRNFKNSKSLTLSAVFEGEDRNASVVIMCHGYESSKDSPLTQKAFSKKLIERGVSVYRFDFTGHGESEGSLNDITPLQGLDDLNSAVTNLNKKDFALYGSSFGGYVALLYASENSVLALALKAPVSDYSDPKSPFALSHPRFVEEVKEINIYKRIKNLKCPVLIVHGDKDDVVALAQSKKLYESLTYDKSLQVIHGADHDIRGEDLEKTYDLIADFFKQNLLK